MRRGSLCLLVASSLALPLLVGCGSEESGTPSTGADATATAPADHRTTDLTVASAALLRPADVPAGWTATPQNGQGRAACAAIQRLRAHPRAVSPGYAHGDVTAVHTVTIFPTAAAADRAFADVVSRANMRCIARTTTQEGYSLFPADVDVGATIASRLDAARLGQRTVATRFALPLRRGAAHARFLQDYVDVKLGRAISILWLRWHATPPDDRLRTSLATTAAARTITALAHDGR